MSMFRLLRADEIDCRIATVKENGLSLLLYKDARCDMNILDETVGEMNWKRSHCRDNANCTVEIWDFQKEQWISKEDTGTESYSEKEKGLASDSFKRACFNWGIGRELYTAPFIWISSDLCKIVPNKGGFTCFDRFWVSDIGYDNERRINRLVIRDRKNRVIFQMGSGAKCTEASQDATEATIKEADIKAITEVIKRKGLTVNSILQHFKRTRLEEMPFSEWNQAMQMLQKYPDKAQYKGGA